MTRSYDPAIDSAILIGVGSVHAIDGPPEDSPAVAGVLIVPDPEQRRGWRERYVYQPPKPGAERRPFGFRKP